MAVKTPIEFTEGIYFITFTCEHWLSLFEITNSYDTVYKWFDFLSTKDHKVKGYSPDSYRDAQSFACSN